ncbi:5397_t:CDS:1, partial [Racocetra fulgida]
RPMINPVFAPCGGDGEVDGGFVGIGQLELLGAKMFTHEKQLTSNKYIFGLVSYDGVALLVMLPRYI